MNRNKPMSAPMRLVFFLGGHDLEMLTIRELLKEYAPGRFFDKGLSWGGKTSDYQEDIKDCLKKELIPVLVELEDDLELDPSTIILVDHHGDRAGENEPTSLHQVFQLMKLPSGEWTRWFELVAANDRGYVPAMVEAGANQEEIVKVRAADRKAQGITPEQEAEGQRATANAEVLAKGGLTLVRLSHSKTATVTDRLDASLGGPGFQNLLIYSPGEVNFFGDGNLIESLGKKFPQGWSGGALPMRGYWGHYLPVPDIEKFLPDKIHLYTELAGLKILDSEKDALEELLDELKNTWPLAIFKMFGSKVKGNADSESDLDILIILPCMVSREIRRRIVHLVFGVNLEYGSNISALVVSQKEWENSPLSALPIHAFVEEEGVLL